jgi:hypothetical protein
MLGCGELLETSDIGSVEGNIYWTGDERKVHLLLHGKIRGV